MNKKKRIPFRQKYKNSPAEWICIIVMCAPAIIHLLVFWLGCQIETFRMAFTEERTGEVNLSNFEWAYKQLFGGASTSNLKIEFTNTMIFFALGCVMIPISMFFAYLIYRRTIGSTFMRLALYLPGAISSIMLAVLYQRIMFSDGPLMRGIQDLFNLEEPIRLSTDHAVLYIIIFDLLVGVGANLILWLGGMSRIPYDLIEYGKLEGVGPFREFATVVLPLIWPTFVTMVSLQVIGLFGASGSILILTSGANESSTLAFWMYRQVQMSETSMYNYVSALGLIFTIITIPLVVICRAIMNRFGEEVEY